MCDCIAYKRRLDVSDNQYFIHVARWEISTPPKNPNKKATGRAQQEGSAISPTFPKVQCPSQAIYGSGLWIKQRGTMNSVPMGQGVVEKGSKYETTQNLRLKTCSYVEI